jgi:hypothetical protein
MYEIYIIIFMIMRGSFQSAAGRGGSGMEGVEGRKEKETGEGHGRRSARPPQHNNH